MTKTAFSAIVFTALAAATATADPVSPTGVAETDTAAIQSAVDAAPGGTVRRCLITRCDARDSGGAGMSGEGVDMTDGLVENCTITENGMLGYGNAGWGGAVCIKGKGTLRGCLVAGNRNRKCGTGVTIVGPNKGKGERTYANSTAIAGIDGNVAQYAVANETGRFGKCFRVNDSTGQQLGNYNYGGVWVNDSGSNSPIDGGQNFTISGWFKHGHFDCF